MKIISDFSLYDDATADQEQSDQSKKNSQTKVKRAVRSKLENQSFGLYFEVFGGC